MGWSKKDLFTLHCVLHVAEGGRSSGGSGTPGVLWAQLPCCVFSTAPDSKLSFQWLCPRESHPSPPQETSPAGSLLCVFLLTGNCHLFPACWPPSPHTCPQLSPVPLGPGQSCLVISCPVSRSSVGPLDCERMSWEYACLTLGKAGRNSDVPCE